jgi:hypothetical protein
MQIYEVGPEKFVCLSVYPHVSARLSREIFPFNF